MGEGKISSYAPQLFQGQREKCESQFPNPKGKDCFSKKVVCEA